MPVVHWSGNCSRAAIAALCPAPRQGAAEVPVRRRANTPACPDHPARDHHNAGVLRVTKAWSWHWSVKTPRWSPGWPMARIISRRKSKSAPERRIGASVVVWNEAANRYASPFPRPTNNQVQTSHKLGYARWTTQKIVPEFEGRATESESHHHEPRRSTATE